jgi:uncharacterized protein (DUF736 family)
MVGGDGHIPSIRVHASSVESGTAWKMVVARWEETKLA